MCETERTRLACGAACGIPTVVTRFAACLVLGIGLASCGPAAVKTDPVKPGPSAKQDDPTCPVLVAGTSVTVEDTDQGAAFVFVTTGDAAAVRTRASALATLHNQHHTAMAPAGGHDSHDSHMKMPESAGSKMQPIPTAQMGTMISVHSNAAASEIPNGARVTFTPASAADVSKLQSELRMHAQHLANGTCEM